jgi:hypothetical protein
MKMPFSDQEKALKAFKPGGGSAAPPMLDQYGGGTSSGGSGYGSSSGQGYGENSGGTEIPVPCPVSDGQAVAAARVPKARSPTPQEISQWMLENYERLPDYQMLRGGGDKPFKLGDTVLWKGNDNRATTKIDHFRGVVSEIDITDEGVVLYVKGPVTPDTAGWIPMSYVQQDTAGWLEAPGGRCIRATEVENELKKQVLCPECGTWRKSQWAYESHYDGKHR